MYNFCQNNFKSGIFLLVFFLILASANCFSQEKTEEKHAPKGNKRVVIIPFEERTYFNDASDIISEKEKISDKEIMNFFRTTINSELSKAMADSCYVTDMLNASNTRNEESILDSIYDLGYYELDVARPNNYQKEEKITNYIKKRRTERKNADSTKIKKTEIKNGEIIETQSTTDDKYLKIAFHDRKIIENIAYEEKADYIIFITQFEIVGNDYRDPYLSGNRNATRKIKIHFTIYDFAGYITHGGFAETNFPFTEDKKQKIIDDYLPEINRQITSNIKFKK